MPSLGLRLRNLVQQRFIPLFAGKPSHPFVPLKICQAIARSGGQGRPQAGRKTLPLTVASTVAGLFQSGAGKRVRQTVLACCLAIFACATCTTNLALSAPRTHSTLIQRYNKHVGEAARRFSLPASWIRTIMRKESATNAHAVSSKGAMGLMQIMPATWDKLRIRYGLGDDPFDPRDNIFAGAAYLRELYDRYGSPGLLAAYNAGPRRYEEFLAGRPLPRETRAYVAALAPFFEGGDSIDRTKPVVVAAVTPRSWTAGPLFVVPQSEKANTLFVTLSGMPKP